MTVTAGVRDASHTFAWTTATIMGARLRSGATVAIPLSTAWPAANTAVLIPFLVSMPVTFEGMYIVTGTSPAVTTIDLGIYRENFTRITSIGSTATTTVTDQVMPVGGKLFPTLVTLTRGRYYMAASAALTTFTTRAAINGNQIMRALGMFKMATAHPLPSTFVPVSMASTAFMPLIGMLTADSPATPL